MGGIVIRIRKRDTTKISNATTHKIFIVEKRF